MKAVSRLPCTPETPTVSKLSCSVAIDLNNSEWLKEFSPIYSNPGGKSAAVVSLTDSSSVPATPIARKSLSTGPSSPTTASRREPE
ncbi:hypothetical protein B0G77_2609 [Paraburkholderia sp. BL10I2N1]|nr:hypothetical protein B0G77_2609 [Paraburkholderia sp. BL10I2N1]